MSCAIIKSTSLDLLTYTMLCGANSNLDTVSMCAVK